MGPEILRNLANWMMIEKCKELDLDASDSRVQKALSKRGEWTYALVRGERPFMQVTFTKSNAPRFIY